MPRMSVHAPKQLAMRTPIGPELDLNTLSGLSRSRLRDLWQQDFGEGPPQCFGRDLLALGIAYARQERQFGGASRSLARELDRLFDRALAGASEASPGAPALMRPGTVLVREWQGINHHVTVIADGFVWNGRTHRSLSGIAQAITGTRWNGPRFFGLRETGDAG